MARFASSLLLMVLVAFVASVHAQLTGAELTQCQTTKQQLNAQIKALQQAEQQSAATSAAISAGPLVPYQPGWAPWPFHTWPFSNTPAAQAAQKHNNYVFQTDNAQIQTLQNQLVALAC